MNHPSKDKVMKLANKTGESYRKCYFWVMEEEQRELKKEQYQRRRTTEELLGKVKKT